MITVKNTVLIIIDVQGKLAGQMHEKESLFENVKKTIRGMQILEIPIIWLEQNPRGLGPTIPEVAELLSNQQPIPKFSFSCCGNKNFMQELEGLKRRQVLIGGIETHVCIYQTAMELLNLGYEVQIIADAVSSRTAMNKQIGLFRMQSEGASLTSTEMVLFELLKIAKGSKFKAILKVVK